MTMPTDAAKPLALLPYVLKFAALYGLISIALIVISSVFQFELPSAMGIVTLMASLAGIIPMFVAAEKRVMTTGERVRFATWVTIAVLLVTLALVVAVSLAFGGVAALLELIDTAKKEASPLIVAIVTAVTVALTWIVTYFYTGFHGRQTLKLIEKKATS